MSKKKKVLIPITIVTGLILIIVIGQVLAGPGLVIGPDFEIDGDTEVNLDPPGDDWESVITGGGPDWNGGPGILIRDGSSGPKATIPELDTFAKGGKFADPTTWTIEPGNTPAQNDLTNVYIYPVLPATEDDDVWMVMGMERIKKQGTFDLDFEYNQIAWDGSSGTLNRSTGDISIGFELSGNPDDPLTDLEVLIIVYEPANTDCTTYEAVYGEGWCQAFRGPAATLEGFGEATMNAVAFPQPPWGSFQSSGAPLDSEDEIQPFFFAEAAINLSALGLEPGCPGFGSVHAKSRSSLEIKADLKDLSGPVSLDIDCWIDGYKFLDVNGDGIWDEGEAALEGWEIQLSGAASSTTTTNSSGYYKFGNLSDGTYAVSEVCPTDGPAWVQTAPGFSECGTEGYTGIEIDIFNPSSINNDFGNGQPNIDVTKTCTSVVELGNAIDYDVDVENTGNVNLYNGTIHDYIGLTDLLTNGLSTMLPGDIQHFDLTYTPTSTGLVTNTVDVTGDYPDATTSATVIDQDTCVTTMVDAYITIEPDATNEVNDSHDFTVTVMKDLGDGGGFVPAVGELVLVDFTSSNGADVQSPSSTTCTTGAAGTCTVSVNSTSAGQISAHASVALDMGLTSGLTVDRNTDGVAPNSDDAVKTYIDAWITINPDATNEVGNQHDFTAMVKKNIGDGAGFVAAEGETVSVTFTSTNGAATQTPNPTSCVTIADGTCIVSVNSSSAGQISAHSSVSLDMGLTSGLTVDRNTDGEAPNSDDAIKTYVDAWIKINPDATNEVGNSHVFTVRVKKDLGDGGGFVFANGETVTVTFASSKGAETQTPNPTSCVTATDGSCTVSVNSDSAGQISAHASVSLDIGLTSGLTVDRNTDGVAPNSDDAVKTYVDAWITINPDATNEVGNQHDFTAMVKKDIGDGAGFVAAEGETLSVTFTSTNGAATQTPNPTSCVTIADGTCIVSVNSSSAGQISAHASVSLDMGLTSGLTVDRNTDGEDPNSDDAVKTYVDARIFIDPDGTNGIGEPHTFTVFAEKNEGGGAGWVAADNGTLVTVTLTNSGGAAYIVSENTCTNGTGNDTGEAAGYCSVTFTSNSAGTVTGYASGTIQSGELGLFRQTGTGQYSEDAVKIFVDGSLTWLKHNSQGSLLGGATFQVCRTHDRDGADIADECVTVLDNSAPDVDGDDGEFKLDDLYLGRYTITETVPPPGYAGDPFVETIELTLAEPDKSATHIWVNVPNQGCTPGWWKNQGKTAYDHHEDWLAVAVTDAVEDYWYGGGPAPEGFDGTHGALFRVAFNLSVTEMEARGLDPTLTLLGAVELGGGNFKALARQGTSALLNSLSVAYEYTDEQVLQKVHDAFVTGNLENLINDFDTANNRDHSFCPIG